ncbi:YdeI/OmpD-associated family protein [Aureicoccus marinus]|uniref:YdhG-like domain-containing protein n=1 Tax=Aureicoccus marinus TaxID=754435 RepID=A0A2S7T3V8_9FLAO|nr:YdeI/OmpD-associated family protein [Aureicoccus marinus]PQJ14612.1 hypothetical protein BST99_01580 [Aureicoccus marinus]
MEKCEKIDLFYQEEHPFSEGVNTLRQWIKECGLEEDYKWQLPTYTWNKKNIVSIAKFKKHYGVWFFQGGLLQDAEGVLQNAQEGKTKAMRHWKFTAPQPDNKALVKAYVLEALENEKQGKRIAADRKAPQAVALPELLQNEMKKDADFKRAFESLSPSKQRDYAEHISSAKREETKIKRWTTIVPMILDGKGLNDKYKK